MCTVLQEDLFASDRSNSYESLKISPPKNPPEEDTDEKSLDIYKGLM